MVTKRQAGCTLMAFGVLPLKGGSDEQLIQTMLQEKHFDVNKLLNTNKEEVRIAPT
jgi:hypothetical protein